MFQAMSEDRRDAALQDWPVFKEQASPFYISAIIDRNKTQLPNDCCPWAPGIVIAGDYLLQAAGCHSRLRGHSGWMEGNPDVFTKVIHGNRLMVRGCGEFWSVEREIDGMLAFPFGLVPMFTRTRQAAMWLAEYCHPKPLKGESRAFPKPRRAASGLRWIVATRDGIRWN